MQDDSWDFEVERVNLDRLSIDAGRRIGMVIAQPEYELVRDGAVPFRISEVYREAQKTLIEKAFQIRAAENQQRGGPIPFILFPEAAIPVSDPDGLGCLRQHGCSLSLWVIFFGRGRGGPDPERGKAQRLKRMGSPIKRQS